MDGREEGDWRISHVHWLARGTDYIWHNQVQVNEIQHPFKAHCAGGTNLDDDLKHIVGDQRGPVAILGADVVVHDLDSADVQHGGSEEPKKV